MDKTRQRYEKAKALAEQGATEGERRAALAAMERMEEAHPELVESVVNTDSNKAAPDSGVSFRWGHHFRYGHSTTSGNDHTFIFYNVVV